VPKSIEIDMDKLHMKFSASNVDFGGPSLDFLGSSKLVHEGIKKWYPAKVVILPLLVSLSFRENSCRSPLACCLSQQTLVMSFLILSTSMTINDPELTKKGFY